ncbi:MAG: hypothetical protein E5V44_11315, partial [Mesorhizobium sp.]
MIDSGFETKSVRMQLLLLVSFQAPSADVDRIMDAVVAITPLGMGSYDSNAFQSPVVFHQRLGLARSSRPFERLASSGWMR